MESSHPNLDFYHNERRSEPDGYYIEDILKWKGSYEKLTNEAYIQWLFPNRSAGQSKHAHPLLEMEAEMIRQTPELQQRGKRAFEMMLDFFGMELFDNNKFRLTDNSDERLKCINVWGSKYFLYISRILVALKEFELDYLMLPWMKFLSQLIYTDKKLDQAEDSFEQFWLKTLSSEDRLEIETSL